MSKYSTVNKPSPVVILTTAFAAKVIIEILADEWECRRGPGITAGGRESAITRRDLREWLEKLVSEAQAELSNDPDWVHD